MKKNEEEVLAPPKALYYTYGVFLYGGYITSDEYSDIIAQLKGLPKQRKFFLHQHLINGIIITENMIMLPKGLNQFLTLPQLEFKDKLKLDVVANINQELTLAKLDYACNYFKVITEDAALYTDKLYFTEYFGKK